MYKRFALWSLVIAGAGSVKEAVAMDQNKKGAEEVKPLYYPYPGGRPCASPDSCNNHGESDYRTVEVFDNNSNHGESGCKIVEVFDNNSNNTKLDRSRLKISNEYAIGFWWYRR